MVPKPAKKSSLGRAPASSSVTKTLVKKATPKKAKVARKSDVAATRAVAEQIVRKVFAEKAPLATVVPAGTTRKLSKSAPKKRQSRAVIASSEVVTLPPPPRPRNEATAAPVPQSDPSVTLPSNVSARLEAKARALTNWYEERFPVYVAKVAVGAGSLFVVCAAVALGQFAATQYSNWQDFQTAALCAALPCEESTTTATNTSEGTLAGEDVLPVLNTPPPAITFLTKPASPLTEPTNLIIRAEYAGDLAVTIESRSTSAMYRLAPAANPAGADYTYALTPEKYSPGEYEVRVRAVAARNGSRVQATGPRFMVTREGARAQVIERRESDALGTATSTTESSTSTDSTAEENEETEAPELSSVPMITTASSTQNSVAMTINRAENPTVRQVVVRVSDARFVELYAQRTSATQPYFVGLMKRADGDMWHYLLTTTSLPNGTYSIYARAKTAAGMLTGPRLPLYVENTTKPLATPPSPVSSTSVATESVTRTQSALEELFESEDAPDRGSYYAAPGIVVDSTTASTTADAEDDAIESAPLRLARESLNNNETELNDLLQRYASAFQSNDEALRALIETELADKQALIVEEAVRENESVVTASELAIQVEEEFMRLRKRVETFETMLRERSRNHAALDTDGDGVADYDEAALYGTDPLVFDTDGDAIPDGVEIMRGFDPLDAAGETVLAFASPKEFGIIRADVLSVSEVVPVIETDTSRGTPGVQAEIRGKALPNTFVTLFIFSTPVVVTVKTDADGSFVYQFDKELEDGAHEVYVAVTDNTGDIIAKSQVFSFIKEAEAFTVNDTTVIPAATTDPNTAPQARELYQVIIAMAVLAFGLILLIIGLTIRKQKKSNEGGFTPDAEPLATS